MTKLAKPAGINLLVLLCLVGGCSSGQSGTATDDGERATQIVGGTASSSFAATGCLSAQGECFCTATLIAPNKVLTAAHCLTGEGVPAATSMEFVLGANPKSSAVRAKVASALPCPRFDETAATNVGDIGIVTLSTNITQVLPAVLGFDDATQLVGKAMRFVGYGVDEKEQGAGTRREAQVTVSSVEEGVTKYTFQGTGACFGDSGGPGFVQFGSEWRQLGIVSAGEEEGETAVCQGTGLQTRLDNNQAWLSSQGISAGERARQCDADGVCDGMCAIDPDCAALFSSGGSPTPPSEAAKPSEPPSDSSSPDAAPEEALPESGSPDAADPCAADGLCNPECTCPSCGWSTDADCTDLGSDSAEDDPCAQDGQCNAECGDWDYDC